MSSLPATSRSAIEDLDARDLLRRRRVVDGWSTSRGATALVDGAERIVFCSNDYLGLSRDPRVVAAFQSAASTWGVGSGASHLITGHSREHHALEEELAEFTGRARAVLFSTGYMANLGVVSALLGREDTVFEDRLNHASLIDAAVLARAELIRYPHVDVAALADRLTRRDGAIRALIVSDGVFSMDGNVAPLTELASIAGKNGAWLMVDDAHGMGVLGAEGAGSTSEFGLSSADVPLLMGTLGKAFGTFGAFVAGDADIIELLIQKARTYVFTTALPPAVAAASRASLKIIQAEPERRARLRDNVARFRRGAAQLGVRVGGAGAISGKSIATPIHPIVLGSSAGALAASESLWQRGLWVSAIRSPTVPEGTARLRITLSAEHSAEQIDRLLEALVAVLPASVA